MNGILAGMALLSVVFGLLNGRMEQVNAALLQKCGEAVPLVLSLTGTLCLWSGLMEIAKRAGLTHRLSILLRPVTGMLLPGFRKNSAVLGMVSMNIAANLLGLGNAATPLGIAAIRAMTAKTGKTATRDIITLIVLNTCSLQLIPSGAAALRLAAGSRAPMEILPPMLAASGASLVISLGAVRLCEKIFPDREGCR